MKIKILALTLSFLFFGAISATSYAQVVSSTTIVAQVDKDKDKDKDKKKSKKETSKTKSCKTKTSCCSSKMLKDESCKDKKSDKDKK